MTLLALPSLQSQGDPEISAASNKLLARVAYSIQVPIEGLSTSSETQADTVFAFSAMVSRLALGIDSLTNERGKIMGRTQERFSVGWV